MAMFRTLVIALWLGLLAYTAWVIARHGLNLLPIFLATSAR